MNEYHDIPCPVCESITYDWIYTCELNGEVLGCSECIRREDASEYVERREQEIFDAHMSECIDAALGK